MKFGRVVFEICGQTDRHANRSTLHPYQKHSNNVFVVYVVDAVPIKNMIDAHESAVFMTVNCHYPLCEVNVTIVICLVYCEMNNTIHNKTATLVVTSTYAINRS